jgi:hypothetical protein
MVREALGVATLRAPVARDASFAALVVAALCASGARSMEKKPISRGCPFSKT